MDRIGKKCVLYSRVSTEMQVDGFSLAGQKTCLTNFANREETECKIEVDDFYWEFESKFKMIQYSKFDMDTLNNISVESGLVV